MFRAVRIRALELHSHLFSQTPQGAEAQPESHWRDTLNGKGKVVFGLFCEDQIIGITAVFTWRERPIGDTGFMAMSFIEPEHRGKGLSALFYQERLKFAINHKPWQKLAIAHRRGNEASKAAILKHGFVFTESNEIDWPDGTMDLEYCYELDLNALRDQAH